MRGTETTGKFQTGQHIVTCQVGVPLKNILHTVPSTEIPEYRIHSDASPTDHGTTTANFWSEFNSLIHNLMIALELHLSRAIPCLNHPLHPCEFRFVAPSPAQKTPPSLWGMDGMTVMKEDPAKRDFETGKPLPRTPRTTRKDASAINSQLSQLSQFVLFVSFVVLYSLSRTAKNPPSFSGEPEIRLSDYDSFAGEVAGGFWGCSCRVSFGRRIFWITLPRDGFGLSLGIRQST